MKRALIIDDDELFCCGLVDALGRRMQDCSVVIARNGIEAARMLESTRFDFIITDLLMPEMGGLEFVSLARAIWPDVPILAMTGTKTPEVEQRLHDLGVRKCIEKQFDVKDMVPLILDELRDSSDGSMTH